MKIDQSHDGKFFIIDNDPEHRDGPFETVAAAAAELARQTMPVHHHYVILDDGETFSGLPNTAIVSIDPHELNPTQLEELSDDENIAQIIEQARFNNFPSSVLNLEALLDLYHTLGEHRFPANIPDEIAQAYDNVERLGTLHRPRPDDDDTPPTNLDVYLHGAVLAHWPCDTNPVDGTAATNAAEELEIEYAGQIYNVIATFDGDHVYQASAPARPTNASASTTPA